MTIDAIDITECQEITYVSKVKVEETGRKAIFLNADGVAIVKTRVDGCVIINQLAADWVISQNSIGDIVVELKGKDVEHAAKQIHATADFWSQNGLRIGKIAALIVCKQYPKASTMIQRAQQAFAKRFGGPLHVVTKAYEFRMEHVLSFKGPHKT